MYVSKKFFKKFEDGISEIRRLFESIEIYVGQLESERDVIQYMMDKVFDRYPVLEDPDVKNVPSFLIKRSRVSLKVNNFYALDWYAIRPRRQKEGAAPVETGYDFALTFYNAEETRTEMKLKEHGWEQSPLPEDQLYHPTFNRRNRQYDSRNQENRDWKPRTEQRQNKDEDRYKNREQKRVYEGNSEVDSYKSNQKLDYNSDYRNNIQRNKDRQDRKNNSNGRFDDDDQDRMDKVAPRKETVTAVKAQEDPILSSTDAITTDANAEPEEEVTTLHLNDRVNIEDHVDVVHTDPNADVEVTVDDSDVNEDEDNDYVEATDHESVVDEDDEDLGEPKAKADPEPAPVSSPLLDRI